MLTLLRVLSVQRSRMSSGLGRGGMTGASFFSSLSEPEPDSSGMLSVGQTQATKIKLCPFRFALKSVSFLTLVLPLSQRGLCRALSAALLLQVSAAVPAVRLLAEPLAGFVVDAFGISDGGPEAERGHTEVLG